jgi:hypothetical protein
MWQENILKTDKMQSKKENIYFNSISNIPMFDQVKLNDRSHFNTTYRQEYSKKKNILEPMENTKPVGFSTYHSYDYKSLTDRMKANNNNHRNKFTDQFTNSIGEFNSASTESFSGSNLNDLSTESRFSFNGSMNVYQRPKIPNYIKRDNYYQSNAERNISYIQTYNGMLLPYVPAKVSRISQMPKIETSGSNSSINKNKSDYLSHFFNDKSSESHDNHSPKSLDKYKSQILPTIRNDNMYHTNGEKNISYIKTNNGSLLTFLPPKEEAKNEIFSDLKDTFSIPASSSNKRSPKSHFIR